MELLRCLNIAGQSTGEEAAKQRKRFINKSLPLSFGLLPCLPTLCMRLKKKKQRLGKKLLASEQVSRDCEMSIPGTHKRLKDNCAQNNLIGEAK